MNLDQMFELLASMVESGHNVEYCLEKMTRVYNLDQDQVSELRGHYQFKNTDSLSQVYEVDEEVEYEEDEDVEYEYEEDEDDDED